MAYALRTNSGPRSEETDKFLDAMGIAGGGHFERRRGNQLINAPEFAEYIAKFAEQGWAACLPPCDPGAGGGKSGDAGDTTALWGGDCSCASMAEWHPEWDQSTAADPWCTFCNP